MGPGLIETLPQSSPPPPPQSSSLPPQSSSLPSPPLPLVTRLPLEHLWDDKGIVEARKERVLTASDIHSFLLRDKPRRFVVASHGSPLLWVELGDSFIFWTSQVRFHLYDAERPNAEEYPNGYYYAAHEWHLADQERIIVLERYP